VQARIPLAALGHKIDETLKGRFFRFTVKHPICRVAPIPVIGSVRIAEQVFETVLAYKGVAFNVKVNITIRRLG
jgi:hypothetical protein